MDKFLNPNLEITAVRRARLARPSTAVASAVLVALAGMAGPAAHADDADISALQQQLQSLQRQIDALKAQRSGAAPSSTMSVPAETASGGAKPSMAPPKPGSGSAPSFAVGPTTVTLGGFVELMVVNRSRNEAADWASNFNTSIPFPQSHNYDLTEFHLTERQSRISALVQGAEDPNYGLEGYLEADFGGTTAGNYNQSGSFAPRVRHFYADYNDKSNGWYLLFGQTWSLVTAEKTGMNPRQENIPLTIDGQYIPGFDWLRAPQIRAVKSFDNNMFDVGFSVENPAVQINSSASNGAPAIPVFDTTAGASSAFVTGTNVNTDYLPDIVAKVSADPGYGHYELFGLTRFFRSRYTVAGEQTNEVREGAGVGGSFLVPVVPKIVDLQGSFIYGKGVGRYGSSGLPDMTVNPFNGSLEPIKGYHALVGIVVRPNPVLTVFAYGGTERDDETAYVVTSGTHTYGYGYGNPLFDNSGCEIEGSSGVCTANTRAITSETIGGWWKFYRGSLGNAQFGATWTFVRRNIFSGIGGAPDTNINIVLASFRYYPFQN